MKLPKALHKRLSIMLAAHGYEPTGELGFVRRCAGVEIEHLLYFVVWGRSPRRVSVKFGFRLLDAEEFCVESLINFGGPVYRKFRDQRSEVGMMCFSLGNAANWKLDASLSISAEDLPRSLQDLENALSIHVSPLVQTVVKPCDLFQVLSRDDDVFSWYSTNAAARATQLLYLGERYGCSDSFGSIALKKHMKLIEGQVIRPQTADGYLSSVLASLRDRGHGAGQGKA